MKRFLTLWLTVASVYATDANVETRLNNRIDAFKEWHKDHALSHVMPQLKEWVDFDHKLIADVIQKDTEGTQQLEMLRSSWQQSFNNGQMTYTKNLLTYFGYGIILDHCILRQEATNEKKSVEQFGSSVNEDLPSIQKILMNQPQDQENYGQANFTFLTLSDLSDFLGYLPFVSQSGLSSFSNLNRSYATKCPLVGLPLKRSQFDGILNSLPAFFFQHDIDHLTFRYTHIQRSTDSIDKKTVKDIYDRYGLVGQSIFDLEDPVDQKWCHAACFFVGHEFGFGRSEPKKLILKEAANKKLDDIIKDLQNLTTPARFDYWEDRFKYWEQLKAEEGSSQREQDPQGGLQALTFDKDYFYKSMIGIKKECLEPNSSSHFMSKILIIEKFGFPKDSVLSDDNFSKRFLSQEIDQVPFRLRKEFPLNISFPLSRLVQNVVNAFTFEDYNNVLGFVSYLNKNGIPVLLWNEDGSYNGDAVGRAFEKIFNTFQEKIVSKMESSL